MKKFIIVNVPIDSEEYYINKVGCLRYSQFDGRVSSCIEPYEMNEYLENDKHLVVGTSILEDKKYVIIEIL